MAHLLKKLSGHHETQLPVQQPTGFGQQQPVSGFGQPQQYGAGQIPSQQIPQQPGLGQQAQQYGQQYGEPLKQQMFGQPQQPMQGQQQPLGGAQQPQQQQGFGTGQQTGFGGQQTNLGWLFVPQQFDSRSCMQVDRSDQFVNGRIDYILLNGLPIAVYHFGNGFNYQLHLGPKFGKSLTDKLIVGFVDKGRLECHLPDGRRFILEPNTFAVIPPGCNLLAQGPEEVVLIDWNGEIDALRRKTPGAM